MRLGKMAWLVPALLVMIGTPLVGQVYRGTVNGTVTDQSGAVVAGAKVAVTDENTHFVSAATTNQHGLYSVPELTPDTYEVKVNAQGFGESLTTQVVLVAGDIKQVDVKLHPATAKAEVSVSADMRLLDTETANIGSVLTPNELHNAPLIDGNPYMAATRVAGIYGNFVQNTESTQFIPVGGGVSGTASEGVANSELATMNGIIITPPEGAPGQYTGYIPPIIAVQELNVQTSVYDAEVGRTIGGVLNTVLKTGTQSLHGEASFLYGDTIFNSNTYNRTALGQPRNDNIWSQPSFVVTGPVVIPKLYNGRDKTHFMVAYQHMNYTTASGTTFVGNVPTVKEQGGDFSELCGAVNTCGGTGSSRTGVIYDPATTYLGGTQPAWCAGSCVVGQRESFTQEYNEPNSSLCGGDVNCIPASRLNAVGLNLLKYFPQPNTPSNAASPGVGNFQPAGGLSSHTWMWMAAFSIDQEFNENNKLTVSFLPYVWNSNNANDSYPYIDGVTGGPGYPLTYRKQYGGLIDYTRVLSPSMVLDLRSGGFYHPFTIPRPGDNINLGSLGFTGETLTFPHPNFPAVSATGPFAGYSALNSGASYYEYSSIFDNAAILTKSFQRHNVKAGLVYTVYRDDPQGPVSAFASSTNSAPTQQPFVFNTTFTNYNPNISSAVSNGGDGIAALLLGYASGGVAYIVPAPAYEWSYYGGFIQDDWRVTPKLTLNVGLRFDYMSPITERHNKLEYGFDFSSVNPMNQGAACSGATCTPATTTVPQGYHGGLEYLSSSNREYVQRELVDRWQPRVGASYQPFRNTVLRGGVGIFFAPTYPAPYNTGFSSSTALVASTNGNLTPAHCTAAQGADAYGFCNMSNPYPNGYVQPTGSSLGLSTGVGGGVTFAGHSWLPPKDLIWTADVEQQLPLQMVLDVAYHGNRITGWPVTKNWNALPNCYYYGGSCPNAGNGPALSASVGNPMAGYLPATSGLNASTLPQYDLYLPYPEFGAVTQTVTVLANTNQRLGWLLMNALYATLTKRVSRGLEFRVAGTFEHFEQATSLLNAGDPVSSLLKYDNSAPNKYLVATTVYDLPKLNVSHSMGYLLNGWKWSQSLNWQAGTTINLPASGNTPGSTAGLIPTGVSPITHHQSLAHWFNSCYIPVVSQVSSTNPAPVYGQPTNCQYGEQPAWIQQPSWTLNQINGNPIRGVRLQEVPYYDMALMKSVPIREGVDFSLRVEAHNVFNNTLLGQGPNTTVTSPAFGTNSQAGTASDGKIIYPQVNDPRIVRLEARLSF